MDKVGFDAVLVLSFGGPDGPGDVVPFLQNVLRGRPLAPGRAEQIAEHYMHFGGHSPINEHNRALVQALSIQLAERGTPRTVYWGNRHWHPLLADTVSQMGRDGIRRAAVFVTSAYSSYSSCRQYLEDIEAARRAVGPKAPELVKLRPFFNHPGFIEPLADGVAAALRQAGPAAPVLMSAHSIPTAMAGSSRYQLQLQETARLVAEAASIPGDAWSLVFQSRSGSPAQPWLGPDVVEAINAFPASTGSVVVAPIGFVSDHMEVVYDLDIQAAEAAAARGIEMVRSATPGADPRFVDMVCTLIDELHQPARTLPRALGSMGPAPSPCPARCCQ
ncbi:MAG: ferrochelatase [Acidimicrobiales bacterium]|nr:ferrochelatase [Acidimicrobiales bacterium]